MPQKTPPQSASPALLFLPVKGALRLCSPWLTRSLSFGLVAITLVIVATSVVWPTSSSAQAQGRAQSKQAQNSQTQAPMVPLNQRAGFLIGVMMDCAQRSDCDRHQDFATQPSDTNRAPDQFDAPSQQVSITAPANPAPSRAPNRASIRAPRVPLESLQASAALNTLALPQQQRLSLPLSLRLRPLVPPPLAEARALLKVASAPKPAQNTSQANTPRGDVILSSVLDDTSPSRPASADTQTAALAPNVVTASRQDTAPSPAPVSRTLQASLSPPRQASPIPPTTASRTAKPATLSPVDGQALVEHLLSETLNAEAAQILSQANLALRNTRSILNPAEQAGDYLASASPFPYATSLVQDDDNPTVLPRLAFVIANQAYHHLPTPGGFSRAVDRAAQRMTTALRRDAGYPMSSIFGFSDALAIDLRTAFGFTAQDVNTDLTVFAGKSTQLAVAIYGIFQVSPTGDDVFIFPSDAKANTAYRLTALLAQIQRRAPASTHIVLDGHWLDGPPLNRRALRSLMPMKSLLVLAPGSRIGKASDSYRLLLSQQGSASSLSAQGLPQHSLSQRAARRAQGAEYADFIINF